MRSLLAVAVLFCVSGWVPGWAQDPPATQQKKAPPRNAKKGDVATFPLGAIGGRAEVLADHDTFLVRSVLPKGPGAASGLRKGDVVVAAAGQRFPKHTRDINVGGRGPMASLGRALERAQAGSGRLALRVRRGDTESELRIAVPKIGAFGSFAKTDKRALRFYDGICRKLLATRRKDGLWKSRTGEDATRYVSALCGLALLGRGDPQHLQALRKVAVALAGPKRRGFVSEDLQQPAGLSNWFICASGIFLSEYVLATGDEQWLPTIQHLCDCLAARQTPQGRYGHGIAVGYSGKGFNVINTHAHLLWAIAQRAGCTIDEKAWRRSFSEIETSTGKNGGVRYWTLQTGYWDACARTGQMALALDLTGRARKLAQRMGGYLETNRLRMREAHAMGSIGMIFGTSALRRVNRSGWRKHMESWRWYLVLMQQPDDSAAYIGGKRNNGGDHYLRTEHVAHAIAGVMLGSGLGNLHIGGNDRLGWLRQ